MKILVVASEPWELRGILSRCSDVRKPPVKADWARSGLMREHELLLVANGAGTKRAGEGLDAALAVFSPDTLASTGLCGALSPDLGPTEIIVATAVIVGNAGYPAMPVDCARRHRQGWVRTLDHIAGTAEEKRHWGATGAIAVEMEAAAVAERAQARGLPFFCIKSVSDLANETLANDLNAALRPDGHFDTMKVLGSSLRHPLTRVPELLRLWWRSARAANVLGDFFADCRI
jgi:adenosylhomocysteine nucleosidase